MQKTQVQSLGREDPLEKEMTTHSSILAWEVPWTEEPGRLQLMESQSWYNCATEHTCGSRSEGKTQQDWRVWITPVGFGA